MKDYVFRTDFKIIQLDLSLSQYFFLVQLKGKKKNK